MLQRLLVQNAEQDVEASGQIVDLDQVICQSLQQATEGLGTH
ncbi:MAG: hypothetical protein RL230_1985 [Pseudomonadota bacterium]